MASGSRDNTIGLWRVSNGERIKTLVGHSSYVNSVVLSPNEKYFAFGYEDSNIGVWKFFD